VEKVKEDKLKVRVLRGDVISERKGVNLPGASLKFDSWGEKDRKALEFGLKLGVDFVAQSFVRGAYDVLEIKNIVARVKPRPKVVAKIENRAAVANIDEIIKVADMIMIARGDMGVCLPVFMVPIIQKEIIAKCLRRNKPVIVATQMLESMRQNPLPLRAEVSDVANAILDGANFLMLSAETAVGRYPVETVAMMRKIIDFTLNSSYFKRYSKN
jgi:pyruvate kinase